MKLSDEIDLLFLSTRVRPDILLAVTFLCTRVHCATRQDAIKLSRVHSYLNATSDLGIVLGSAGDELSVLT